ncbi:MAG: hypothetical protein ACE5OZ_24235 [Candidatus Heimdallarchaeota archaeon]
MSLATFVLKSDTNRYTIGAYLFLGTIFAIYLSPRPTNGDLVASITKGLPLASLFIIVLIYIRPEDKLNSAALWIYGNSTGIKSVSNLIKSSQLPYLNRSKDMYFGSFLFSFGFLLLGNNLETGSKFYDFFSAPTDIEEHIAGICYLFAFFFFIVGFARFGVYSSHLMLCWRFYTLHLSPKGDNDQQELVRQFETYLSLGVWQLAESLQKEADMKIYKTLEGAPEELDAANTATEWCLDIKTRDSRPRLAVFDKEIKILAAYGFEHLDGQCPSLLELIRKAREFLVDFQNNSNGLPFDVLFSMKEQKLVESQDILKELNNLRERIDVELVRRDPNRISKLSVAKKRLLKRIKSVKDSPSLEG